MKYRQATASDVAAIARLHAESWRRHYRGAYLDSYLDGDVVADRIAEWSGRLSGPGPAGTPSSPTWTAASRALRM
jgi:hypothetical protein